MTSCSTSPCLSSTPDEQAVLIPTGYELGDAQIMGIHAEPGSAEGLVVGYLDESVRPADLEHGGVTADSVAVEAVSLVEAGHFANGRVELRDE